MNSHWFNRNDNSELILFFNGWGMDTAPVKHIKCGSFDVLEFHNYSSPELDFDILDIAKEYDSISLIAWSLGIWAAIELVSGCNIIINRAIAINGTTVPISDNYGLSPDVFQGTIDNWSEKTRVSFNLRMCKNRNILEFFNRNMPNRSVKSQKKELVSLQKRINSRRLNPALFDYAVTGKFDKIFLPDRQQSFWNAHSVPNVLIDSPHFLFSNITDWSFFLGL